MCGVFRAASSDLGATYVVDDVGNLTRNTEQAQNFLAELSAANGSIPVRRLAQPWEVARAVHFLAADVSGYITGQVWGVDGGLDM
jgi:NAD(P)-dependent dehydrogenase (short-subunit alcohol dehydrogenase family)